jgi:phosphoglycolate phosphatase
LFFQEYEKCFCEKTSAFPGICEAILELKKKKFKLGVLSNKPDQFVKVIIAKLFGEKTFDFVMGKSDFPHKPDPSSALFVAKEMGVKPHKCSLVGDSDIDMKTAENAGMRSIGVQWGYRSTDVLLSAGADYIASSPTEMIEHALECMRITKMERKLRKRNKDSE